MVSDSSSRVPTSKPLSSSRTADAASAAERFNVSSSQSNSRNVESETIRRWLLGMSVMIVN